MIYLLGSTGMLGHQVRDYLEKGIVFIPLASHVHNFKTEAGIKGFLDIVKSDDLVVNCSGRIKPTMPKILDENSLQEIFMINSYLPRAIVSKCKLIQISTDCVFDGVNGWYKEDSDLAPQGLYGMTKALGEDPRAMVIRCSIIGPETKNNHSLYEWFLNQDKANGFTNHAWNGVTTLQLAKCIYRIIFKDMYKPGIFHVHSPHALTKYDLLCKMNEYRDNKAEITPVSAPKSMCMTLSTNHTLLADLDVPDFDTQMKELHS